MCHIHATYVHVAGMAVKYVVDHVQCIVCLRTTVHLIIGANVKSWYMPTLMTENMKRTQKL